MAKSVFAIVDSRAQAAAIVEDLRAAGFASNDISALFPDKDTSRDFAHEQNTKAPEGAAVGAGTGGLLGGGLGWLAGIGALAIPGLGPFIAAGPIMAALGGAAIGATAGGLTGALVGFGIPEYEAKRYEGKVARRQHPVVRPCRERRPKPGSARRYSPATMRRTSRPSGESIAPRGDAHP